MSGVFFTNRVNPSSTDNNLEESMSIYREAVVADAFGTVDQSLMATIPPPSHCHLPHRRNSSPPPLQTGEQQHQNLYRSTLTNVLRQASKQDMAYRHQSLLHEEQLHGKLIGRNGRYHMQESASAKCARERYEAVVDMAQQLEQQKIDPQGPMALHIKERVEQSWQDWKQRQQAAKEFYVTRVRMQREVESDFYPELPLLANRFVMQAFLGAGGSAEVWRCLDTNSGQSVALKIGKESWISREVQVHSRLRHTHIVSLIDSETEPKEITFEYNDKRYGAFAMPAAPFDLQMYMEDNDALELAECIEIMRQLFLALTYMHDTCGIAHFDIKPSNILVFPDGKCYLTDFQLSKRGSSLVKVSKEGTLLYLAPECLCQDHIPVECSPTYEKVDMWAAGVLMYQLLYGEHPILPSPEPPRKKSSQILVQFNGQVMFPERLGVQPWMKSFICQCLQPNFTQRPTAQYASQLFTQNGLM